MTSLRISEGLYKMVYSNLIQKHFSQSRIEYYHVMQSTSYTRPKSLVFGRVETIYQHQQSIDLCEFKPYFFGLSCNILNRFAAIHSHDLILGRIFQYFEQSVDEIDRQIPLIYFFIDLSSSVEKKLAQSSHRFTSYFLASVF